MVPAGRSQTPCRRPIDMRMETNGVAREFWNEVFDLRAAVQDPREKRSAKEREKRVRRIAAPRPTGRAPA
jgi:hypothetical protein